LKTGTGSRGEGKPKYATGMFCPGEVCRSFPKKPERPGGVVVNLDESGDAVSRSRGGKYIRLASLLAELAFYIVRLS